jgi:hypothetical protein
MSLKFSVRINDTSEYKSGTLKPRDSISRTGGRTVAAYLQKTKEAHEKSKSISNNPLKILTG